MAACAADAAASRVPCGAAANAGVDVPDAAGGCALTCVPGCGGAATADEAAHTVGTGVSGTAQDRQFLAAANEPSARGGAS